MKFKFQFGEGQSSIQLNIPSEGAVTPEGWNIIVPHTLEVSDFRTFVCMILSIINSHYLDC